MKNRKYKKVQWVRYEKLNNRISKKNIIPHIHRRLFYFVEKLNFNKTHQKKSIAVNKLGSIFHISLKNLSGYIQVHKKRICCLDFE